MSEKQKDELEVEDSAVILNSEAVIKVETELEEPEKEVKTTEDLAPRLRRYPAMKKYAGAQIIKYFKITAHGNVDEGYHTLIKEGKIGSKLTVKTKKHKDFTTACEYAEKQIEKKKTEGFKEE